MNSKNIFLILLFVLNLSCQNKCDCTIDLKVVQKNDSILNTINSVNKINYQKYLESIKEPDLRFENNEVYRVSIKNLMNGSTFVYRIQNDFENYTMIVKKNYKTGKGGDSIEKKSERTLLKSEWNNFQSQIHKSCFWTFPVRNLKEGGFDGSIWTLEANSPNRDNCTGRKFHAVVRWSPKKETEFYKLCNLLIEFDNEK